MKRVMGKYLDWTRGQVEALINIVGEESAKKLLAGDITVEFREVVRVLFDKYGRRIPQGLLASTCDCGADRYPRPVQPELDDAQYTDRISRLHGCLWHTDTGITAEQFRAEFERLLALVRDTPQITNIVNGVHLPIIMPRPMNSDLGAMFELYIEGVNKSYDKAFNDPKTFDDKEFYNRKEKLIGEVDIVAGSRHDQLIERMKQGPVIGIHFPNSLQGYSISADIEQMSTLPKGFALSGLDAAITMIMYPDVLACRLSKYGSFYSPGFDMAAISWRRAKGFSFGFTVHDTGLGFDIVGDHAYGSRSGGLFFYGC